MGFFGEFTHAFCLWEFLATSVSVFRTPEFLLRLMHLELRESVRHQSGWFLEAEVEGSDVEALEDDEVQVVGDKVDSVIAG